MISSQALVASAIFFVIAFAIVIILKIKKYNKIMKKLGEIIFETPGGFANSDLFTQTLMLILVISVIVAMYALGILKEEYLLGAAGVIGVFTGFVIFTLYIATKPKGFYDNGISDGTGAILYTDIKRYEMASRKYSSGMVVNFIPLNGILSANHFLYINFDMQKDVKRIIKTKCSFARNQVKKKKKKRRK